MTFIKVYLYLSISILILAGAGNIFLKLFKFEIATIYEKVILGSFLLGVSALILNFFISLNPYVCSILTSICLIFSFKEIKHIKIIIFISLLAFITIIFEISNRPDAGLYHLPFISILNDQKIILGLNNLHSRFGYTSFFQYLSAAFNNHLFLNIGITIPMAILHASSIIYFYYEAKLKNRPKIARLISFLFLIIIFVDMNRYSEFGNDEISHIIFFYFILNILKFLLNSTNYKDIDKINLISLFLFTLKGIYAVVILIPIFFIYKYFKKHNFFNKNNFLCLLIFFFWITKNILITGCLVFPKSQTCFQNFSWSNSLAKLEEIETEAWAKGLPNYKGIISKTIYIKNFNWALTWSNNHFFYILKKITPIIIIFSLIVVFFEKKNFINNNYYYEKTSLNLLLFFSIISLIYWFLNFPLYRFGAGFIFVFLVLSFAKFCLKKKIEIFISKYLFNIFAICLIIISLKHSIRIQKNYNIFYIDYPWPKIYSYETNNEKILKKRIYYNNSKKDFYYSPLIIENLCFYDSPPCTTQLQKLNINIKFNYKIISQSKY